MKKEACWFARAVPLAEVQRRISGFAPDVVGGFRKLVCVGLAIRSVMAWRLRQSSGRSGQAGAGASRADRAQAR